MESGDMKSKLILSALALATLFGILPGTAAAVEVTRSPFGTLADGRAVEAITLTNGHGVSARIITLGAAVQSLLLPDRQGTKADVVLGFTTASDYAANPQYFGATVGRFANRIAKGRFALDGKSYALATNNGPNSLHGGLVGFDKVIWSVNGIAQGPTGSVTLKYISPDGDQGYPGTLTVTAMYSLNGHDELSVEYRATTDEPTVVNISNHSYFNLAGEGAAEGVMHHLLMLPAEEYTPVDKTLIPTGEFRHVAGTAFDFRTAKAIGRDIRTGSDEQLVYGKGYDHNWVVSRAPVSTPRLVARLTEPVSGRVMEILSNQPGIQFYSGNFLDATVTGKSGHIYRQGDAIVLEPQLFPDTPNQPAFGSARLAPGDTYVNRIIYRFSVSRG
jgi:aldose 1-epimerase